jgi:alpha-tubulin suppressor-like RCC1 family protein
VGAAAIKTDGTLWGWGQNNVGQVGDGTVVNKSSPVQIGALTNWAQVGAFFNHTLAVKTDGTLWAWGDNSPDGELGDGTVVDKSSPVQIGLSTSWVKVALGSRGNSISLAIIQGQSN